MPEVAGGKLLASQRTEGGDDMRLGTFVLGGLMGAAAVIYLSDRKNRSMKFSAFTSPVDTLGKMMGGTMGLINNFTDNNRQNKTAAATGAPHATTSANAANMGTNGLTQVQKIVNEDPELKKTVNDILQDNGKSSMNLQ
jgi:hypothetical protein